MDLIAAEELLEAYAEVFPQLRGVVNDVAAPLSAPSKTSEADIKSIYSDDSRSRVSSESGEQVETFLQVEEQQPLTAMQEFARAWARLAPGGAFAPPLDMESDTQPAIRGRMNVLEWDTW